MKRFSLIARVIVLSAVFTVVAGIDFRLPSQSVPWGTLDLTAPPGFFTDMKLARMRDDPQMCQAALKAGGTQFTAVADETIGICPLENRVLLQKSDIAYSNSVKANCGLVAALSIWERQVVAKAAAEHLSSEVTRINQAGDFSCRTIRGSTRMSNHSTATALDVTGFRLKDGRTVSVLRDWGKDTEEGRFLRAVRDGACPVFRGVLGPDYNDDHKDHFHLDIGRFNICR